MHIDKRCVYGLPVAMNVAHFIAFCGKLEYGRSECIFAYISMTTRARDFKFAGTPVQRLQLALVGRLNSKSFSAQYAWFSRGGSHIVYLFPYVLFTFLIKRLRFINLNIPSRSWSLPLSAS